MSDVSWLRRAFVACNKDRRFAWGELRCENERSVGLKKESDQLRAVVERVRVMMALADVRDRAGFFRAAAEVRQALRQLDASGKGAA